jgi:anti-sigma regulatory factor (Ser/Thr protein kinase)
MATQNSNPEADHDAPPVTRALGLAVSEWVVYSFIVITVIAVIFGFGVGGERDAQAERAMATLTALTEEVENRVAAGGELACDNTLLDSALLANDYLTLSISQVQINDADESLGDGPALYVSVVEEEVSGDTWDTAKRLMDLVKQAGEEKEEEAAEADDSDKKPKNALRKVKKTSFGEDEEYLRYYILASEVAICS